MKLRQLGEFVTIIQGVNPTRVEKQLGTTNVRYYDQRAFEQNYYYEEVQTVADENVAFETDKMLAEGDVVISNSSQLATIVGKGNAGKILSLNFTQLKFLNDELDKRYFIYLFNAYSEVKKQKKKLLQGNGTVFRISIKELSQLLIPILPIEQQQKIGLAYENKLKMQSKLQRYSHLIDQMVSSVLEENVKG